MTSSTPDLPAPHTRRNPLQLGLFCLNLERGGTASTMPGTLQLSWPEVSGLARRAESIGLDMLVPVARWKGFGGVTDYAGASYDTFCWAAGLAAETERIRLMTTCHVPTIHPLVAAKQLTTIDHISGGRIGVNVVGGWFRPELEMFGRPLLEHDRRYDLAEEWTKVLESAWTSDEPFDFQGEFFTVKDGISRPKPVQRPRPPIMNAGGSPRGQRFAAEHADMVFLLLTDDDFDSARAKVEDYKQFARREFGREIEVWSQITVICGETTAEAKRIERRMLEHGDVEAVTNMLRIMGVESAVLGASAWQDLVDRFIAGWGGLPAIGDPETVADRLQWVSDAGIDGCLMVFPDWNQGLSVFGDRVMPILEERGLRVPAPPVDASARIAG